MLDQMAIISVSSNVWFGCALQQKSFPKSGKNARIYKLPVVYVFVYVVFRVCEVGSGDKSNYNLERTFRVEPNSSQ